MLKIARLPDSIFAPANLAFCLPPQALRPRRCTAGEPGQRPPALSKPAGRGSTEVEANVMKPRILVLTVALLCLLAVPNAGTGRQRARRQDRPERRRRFSRRPAAPSRYRSSSTRPAPSAEVTATIPLGVDITKLPLVDGVAAFLTPDEIHALGDASFVTEIVADNPVHGFELPELRWTSPTSPSASATCPRRRRRPPAGAGVTVADPRQRRRHQHRPRQPAASSAGRTSSTASRRRTTTPVTAPSSPG